MQALADTIEKLAVESKIAKSVDDLCKVVKAGIADDDKSDADIAKCLDSLVKSTDAMCKAQEVGFSKLASCLDRNTAALEKLAKAEQREVRVEVKQEKDSSLAGTLRMLVESQRQVVDSIGELVKMERKDDPPPPPPKPPGGHHFEIQRDGNGDMMSVKVTPIRPHPITVKIN